VLIAEATKAPSLIAVLAPFVLSIAFLVLSPLLTRRANQIVQRQINQSNKATGDTAVTVPAAVDPKNISDYVEQAADAIQFLPLTLLPIAGVIFAISSNIAGGTALTVLTVLIVVLLAGDIWLTTTSAQNYASRKFLKLSIAAWAGVLVNGFSIGLLLLAG
jgi:ABC-type multidrug transport system fused ATPase/permease subunit